MKIETLKKNHLKRNIIIGVGVVLVISAVVLQFTKAKYRVTESIPLVNGTINYTLPDFNAVAVYINSDSGYTKSDTIPESGYVLNETESYCTVNGERNDNISLSYNTNTKSLSVSPMTTKGTKCYLYFDVKPPTNAQEIIASKTISSARSGSITGVLTTNTTGTVYSVADDDGTSYVYAGAPTDNWVRWAGFYWRIIRINGDGTIRIIYEGTNTRSNGTSSSTTQTGTSAFNSSYNDNAYVGLKYGSTRASSYSATHANTNNSTILTALNTWYNSNLKDYADDIDTNAGFCGDREISSVTRSEYGTLGYGTNVTAYAPTDRFSDSSWSWLSSHTPTLKCSQTNDLFTVSGSSKGNKALTNPIGLITADEVVLAGGFGGTANSSYYLYTGQDYWTMSPLDFGGGRASVFGVYSDGLLSSWYVNAEIGVRPVINLKANTTFSSGNGTANSPFVVQ